MYNLLNLRQVSARKLKPQTQPPPTLHERILEGIKSERKLRPVSPGEVRRGRLGKDALRLCFHGVVIFFTLLFHKKYAHPHAHEKKNILQSEMYFLSWSMELMLAPAGHHVQSN